MMGVKSLIAEEQVAENVSQFTHNKIAGKISKFTKKEIYELFKKAHILYKASELEIKAKAIKNHKNPIGRILLIIPKKVGPAPKRNLIRRRIKSIFYQEKLYLLGYNFIVLVKKDILKLTFQDLKNIFLGINLTL